MAHVNFKTINKLAKEGLVDGLPLKVFTNEHNCVACNKGKQHKASYKHISVVRLITETLQLLHMDLFGPTNIRSIDQNFAGPSSSNGPSVMERNADYAEELAKLQRQEYEAKDAAARYGYLFSQETAEILSASTGSDPAGGFQPTGSYEPAGQGNSAVSTFVSADFIPVHAAESTLPPGQSLGSSENT
ncbi:hypothetical protein Tco_1248429, partial [Tanacetum coccineum]